MLDSSVNKIFIYNNRLAGWEFTGCGISTTTTGNG